MAVQYCDVEEVELIGSQGKTVKSVQVTCRACKKSVSSWGIKEASIKRCFVLLSEECPEGKFYMRDPDDVIQVDEPKEEERKEIYYAEF